MTHEVLDNIAKMLRVLKIDWTPEKADILWKVIERSRSLGGGTAGADCMCHTPATHLNHS